MTRMRFVLYMCLLPLTLNAQQTGKHLTHPLPEKWQQNDALFQQVLPIDDRWWTVFEDATLDSLIHLAIDQNPSALMALNRIDMAKANLGIARSDYFPTFDINGGWTR